MADLAELFPEVAAADIDLRAFYRMSCLPFGAPEPKPPFEPLHPDQVVALQAPDGVSLAARAQILPMPHFVGGHLVTNAAIAGVAVSPAHNGRGVGSRLMRLALRQAAEQGYATTTLYPTNMPFYRHLGCELIAARQKVSLATTHLPHGKAQDTLLTLSAIPKPHRSDALKQCTALLDQNNQWVTGGIKTQGTFLEFDANDDLPADQELLLAYRGGDLVGFCVWQRSGGYRPGARLSIGLFTSQDVQASESLLTAIGSYSSVAERVEFVTTPGDPLQLLLPGSHWQVTAEDMYAARILNVEGALRSRGAAPGCAGQVTCTVADDLLPQNQATFQIAWADGHFTVARTNTEPDATVDIRGLSLLYFGVGHPEQLRSHYGEQWGSGDLSAFAAALRSTPPVAQQYF